jgi:hypothetical protein
MVIKKHDRQYDIVVFGATGYTGKLTAEHITKDLPLDLKWAVAGRSRQKLEELAANCKSLNSERRQPGKSWSSLIYPRASANHGQQISRFADSTRQKSPH